MLRRSIEQMSIGALQHLKLTSMTLDEIRSARSHINFPTVLPFATYQILSILALVVSIVSLFIGRRRSRSRRQSWSRSRSRNSVIMLVKIHDCMAPMSPTPDRIHELDARQRRLLFLDRKSGQWFRIKLGAGEKGFGTRIRWIRKITFRWAVDF